jgi:hypothetical protein
VGNEKRERLLRRCEQNDMGVTRQRRQPSEAVHAIRLKVLVAASSAQRAAPPRLTVCAEAVFAL